MNECVERIRAMVRILHYKLDLVIVGDINKIVASNQLLWEGWSDVRCIALNQNQFDKKQLLNNRRQGFP